MAYYLVAPTGHAAELPPRPICVGCDPSADIPIMASIGLAPRHFVLVPLDRGFRLQSLAPEALLKVNGIVVQSHDLHVGDVIQAGALALRFQDDPKLMPDPSPMPQELDAPPMHLMAPAPHELEPPPLGDEAASVRHGFHPPESPRPLDLDDEDSHSQRGSALPGVGNLDRALAVTARANAFMQEQKAEQNFTGAILAGGVVAVGVAVVWAMTSFLPLLIFLAIASGLGYVIGSTVRSVGKGIDLKFGYLAAMLALAGGIGANVLKVAAFTEASEPVSQSGKVEIYGADEATNESLRASMADLGIDPDSPEFRGDEDSGAGAGTLVLLLLQVFGPRSLIAYAIVIGAAYKSSFRTLTADEAARMQFG